MTGSIGYYFDEDASDGIVVGALLQAGITVATARSEGLLRATDEENFRRAASLGLVMVTCNQGDFYQLHTRFLSSGETHSGLLIIPQKRFQAGERIRRLLILAQALDGAAFQDRVEFLQDWREPPGQP